MTVYKKRNPGKTADRPFPEKRGRIDAFREKMLQWYDENRRPLPWRLNPTPYRVWISEIMLQQTQASTVISYYDRFLRRFPGIKSLAHAPEEAILSLWSGLGYYSRARNIHKTARLIVQSHNGRFPADYGTILSLPGIGRYTAGAICSIAFNQPQPVVDGNIRRVITRLKGIRNRIPEKYFWDQMAGWIPAEKPSAFNQAMMELGAVVCLPARPLCPQCPVQGFCLAKRKNIQNSLPLSRPKQAVKNIELVMLVLKHKGRFLLMLQENSFIPGKWGLPYEKIASKQSPVKAAIRLSKRLFGGAISTGCPTVVRHSITHRRILAYIFTGEVHRSAAQFSSDESRTLWATDAQLSGMLTSSLFRKALKKSSADAIEFSA